LVDLQRMAYPHKWSPISCKSSAGQRKDTGQRPMLYRWTTQPAGSSSNAMWPGTRPTCSSSFTLIRPTVWPQYTNVTDRQDRTGQTERQTDNGLIAWVEQFYKRSPKNNRSRRSCRELFTLCVQLKS